MAKRYMQSSPQGEFLEPTKDLRGTQPFLVLLWKATGICWISINIKIIFTKP